MSTTLQEAISIIKAGNKIAGRQMLAQILQADPQNESAWLWMSSVVDSDKHRQQCLQRVLVINPDNEMARRGINTFQQQGSVPAPVQPDPIRSTAPKQTLPVPRAAEPLVTPVSLPVPDLPVEQTSPRPPVLRKTLSIAGIEEIKKCPYCAEMIKAEAIVCRFCGRNLETGQSSSQQLAAQQLQVSKTIYVVDEKNPDTAGCLNLLIPGLGYVYIGDWSRALVTWVVASIIIGLLIGLMSVDAGMCSGPTLIGVAIILFIEARKAAQKRNQRIRDLS